MREISKFKLEYHSWIPCNTLLLFDIFRWLVDEEDAEAVGGATTHYHQPLTNIEAISDATATIAHASVVATTIAQASAIGSQGGSSNLQRFQAHHPLTFRGGGDSMVADHWFRQVGKIMEAMEITSDTTKIKLAAFQL